MPTLPHPNPLSTCPEQETFSQKPAVHPRHFPESVLGKFLYEAEEQDADGADVCLLTRDFIPLYVVQRTEENIERTQQLLLHFCKG